MALDKKDILESGLLELYAIGALKQEDINLVEKALVDFPELKDELSKIEASLESYARLNAVKPSPAVKTDLLNKLGPDGVRIKPDTGNRSGMKTVSIILLLAAAIVSIYFGTRYNSLQESSNKAIAECDSTKVELQNRITRLEEILSANSRIIPINATEKYPQTQLYFHLDDVAQTNYIQIKQLPEISDDQRFQLWSLKSDQDPIPMELFAGTEDIIIPVSYISETNAYAITIESAEGAEVPDLDNLIGVFSI